MKKVLVIFVVLCLFAGNVNADKSFSSKSPSSSSSSKSYSSGPSKSYSSKSYSSESNSPKADSPKTYTSGPKTYSSKSVGVGGDDNSRKPSHTNFNSDLSRAAKEQESRAAFQRSKSYKDVEINENHSSTKVVRNLPPERIQNHTIIVEKHYHDYYGPRYDYYRSQPSIYVGGGYSSLFWYAMLDWDINRRAAWLYNHQNEIDSQLYQQQLQNAELRGRIEQMQRDGRPDSSYVDRDFRDNPQAQYDAEFVKNASTVQGGVSAWTVFKWLAAIAAWGGAGPG